MGEVYRYNEVHSQPMLEGKLIDAVARGFLARLIQHEVGHLNTELYIDRLRPDCHYGSIEDMLQIIDAMPVVEKIE